MDFNWFLNGTNRPFTIVLIPFLYGYRYLRMNLYQDLFNRKGIKIMVIQLKGHKLGEFAPTRTFQGHARSDKKSCR
jgi:hypothetical protein